jgi:hypothetical protein
MPVDDAQATRLTDVCRVLLFLVVKHTSIIAIISCMLQVINHKQHVNESTSSTNGSIS